MGIDATRVFGEALATGGSLSWLSRTGTVALDIDRWRAAADADDSTLIDRCEGPVLDVGCGPGRVLHALRARGVHAAGVDVSPHAVELARAGGGTAVCADVFSPLPGEGGWQSVVLLDGNIGIGGRPERLLRRVHQLLAPGGTAYLETHADPDLDERQWLRLVGADGRASRRFAWSFVGAHALARHAEGVGLAVGESWTAGGRCFVGLRSADIVSRPGALAARTAVAA